MLGGYGAGRFTDGPYGAGVKVTDMVCIVYGTQTRHRTWEDQKEDMGKGVDALQATTRIYTCRRQRPVERPHPMCHPKCSDLRTCDPTGSDLPRDAHRQTNQGETPCTSVRRSGNSAITADGATLPREHEQHEQRCHQHQDLVTIPVLTGNDIRDLSNSSTVAPVLSLRTSRQGRWHRDMITP